MGQKVNPIGFRLGIYKTWPSSWYSEGKEYAKYLHEDIKIRELIHKQLKKALVSKIYIERTNGKVRITISTARPGVVIGKKGADIENIKNQIIKVTGANVSINITEVRRPEKDARLVAAGIAAQLEKRINFKKAMKKAIQMAMKYGVEGIKVSCSGRLGGAEIARTEWLREGRVPLHTLRANIDYGTAEANTTYSVIGVKVWIYLGEIGKVSSNKRKTINS